MTRQRVVVIGGGLAGIAAALNCADRGCDVTLFEARTRLGGATYSFRRDGMLIDTGQHVVLRCYAAYAGLLRRMGVLDGVAMQPRFRVPVLDTRSGGFLLQRWSLPAPWHLVPVLLNHRSLTIPQRMRAARTAVALRGLHLADPRLDGISFAAWLEAQGEDPRTVQVLWALLVRAALNAEPGEASLALAAKVFRTGVLDASADGDIGIPLRPLGELHGAAAHRALVDAGVRVVTQSKVRALRRTGAGLSVSVRDRAGSTEVDGAAVIVAVPHQNAASMLEDFPLVRAFEWSRLSATPIVNVHVVYDRKVTDVSMAAVLDSPVQWVFDRTAASGLTEGQYLAISLSAAHQELRMTTQALRERFLPALEKLFPRAHHAVATDFFVTREPRATVAQAPGSQAIRPRVYSGIPGLFLAGAWTATGWPDTTEGAVRSGMDAAAAVDLTCRDRDVEVTA